MNIIEEKYFSLTREIQYRAFEILAHCDRLKLHIHNEEDELANDVVAGIDHAAEMIVFALDEARKAVNEDTEKMLKELAHGR